MKFVVCGNYGAQNLGDEMILEGVLTMLRSIDSAAEITIMSGNPSKTSEKYSGQFSTESVGKTLKNSQEIIGPTLRSLPKFSAGFRSIIKNLFTGSKSNRATEAAVKDCDFFILGGGGLFGSLTLKANLIWAIQALKAYKYGKPVIMYGQSVSPIRWKPIRLLVRKIFQKAALITVRDEASKEELQKIGVTKEIHMIPDLAMRVDMRSDKRPDMPAISKNTIIVALRQMQDLTSNFHKCIAEFLDWLITAHNYQVKFINFQEGPEEDGSLHKKIADQMKNQKHTEILANIQSTDELLGHFRKSSLVLGMRLHSIISAIKTATPFIAISYSPKVENFLDTMNLSETMINLGDLSPENLNLAFEKTQKNHSIITENLKAISEQALKNHQEFELNHLQVFLNSMLVRTD